MSLNFFYSKRRLDQEPEQNISNKSALLSILELFLFIWLIIGKLKGNFFIIFEQKLISINDLKAQFGCIQLNTR